MASVTERHSQIHSCTKRCALPQRVSQHVLSIRASRNIYSPVIKEWDPNSVMKFGTPYDFANFSKTVSQTLRNIFKTKVSKIFVKFTYIPLLCVLTVV